MRTRGRRAAFTLVEAVLTIVVVGMSIVAIVEMLRVALVLPQESVTQTSASYLLQAKMDQVLGKKFADIRSESWTPVAADAGMETLVEVENFETTPGMPVVAKKVRVTIRWDGGKRSESVSTIQAAKNSSGG